MNRGKLIVLCGIDGCGKSTILKKLSKNENDKFLLYKHPPKEWFDNPKIRAAYLDEEGIPIEDEEEIRITYELRKKEEVESILPQLKRGKNIIFHRYIFSLYAYYRGIDKYSLEELSEYFADVLQPDLVIYLKIGIEEFYRRFQTKEQLSYQKNSSYVKRVMECYEELAQKYNWSIVDTENDTIDDCVEKIRKTIDNIDVSEEFKYLNGLQYKDISYL